MQGKVRALRRGTALAVLVSGMFMTNVDVAVVNVATPSIQGTLRASGAELQLVVSAYVLVYAMGLVTAARLGGVLGYRRLFLAGVVTFTLASLACGLAPGAVPLIAARAAQGAGAAMLVPQVLTGIQLTTSGRSRAHALGMYAVALSGGAVAGQVIGGVLIAADVLGTGWRPIFLVNVPVGCALLVAGALALPHRAPGDRTAPRLDLGGVALLASAVLLVVLPLVLGRQVGWPLWTWACLAASVPLAAGFVGWERRLGRRGGAPLLDLRIFARRAVRLGIAAQAVATGTYYATLFTLALFLQQAMGRGPLFSGLALVSWVAAFGVAGPVLPHVPARLARAMPAVGLVLLGLAYTGIAATLLAGRLSDPALIALLGLGGLGLGLGFSSNIAVVTASVPPANAPDVSGAMTMSIQLSAVLGVAVIGGAYLGLGPALGPDAFAASTGVSGAVVLLASAVARRASRAG